MSCSFSCFKKKNPNSVHEFHFCLFLDKCVKRHVSTQGVEWEAGAVSPTLLTCFRCIWLSVSMTTCSVTEDVTGPSAPWEGWKQD